MATPELARGLSITAPVGGWDAITPWAAMPETQALVMDNVFPQPGYVEIRKGHKRHNLITGAPAIESLMAYHALDEADDKLFAAATTAVYDVTAVTTATVSAAALSGLSNARWNHLNMSTVAGNFLWMANGADVPHKYDGSTFTTASITGVTSTDIISATVFKERIWMVLNGSISPAYLEPDAVQGTATVFDLGGVFNRGGYLMAIGSWSTVGGDTPDDRIAFVTSRGEVAVYQGTNPGSNFNIVGRFEMGAPIGRRCLRKVGADLAIVCIDGVVPISRAIFTDRAAVLPVAITKAIQPVVNQSARSYKGNFGWELIGYPRGTRAILNVPVTENVEQHQYVMNTITGAWCRFLAENANCWELFGDRLFYGGNDGIVREADCQGYDDDGDIEFNVETAFNYCGNRGRLKQCLMARALLTTDGQVFPGLAINVDFARNTSVDPITTEADPAALWDVALWDGGVWPEAVRIQTDWVTVSGEGYCASIKMSGTVTPAEGVDTSMSVTLQINGWDMLVIDGAFL